MNIKEASLMTGVSTDMLRHYEKLGIITPKRHPGNGYRNYSQEDINNVVMIKQYSSLGLSLKTLSLLAGNGNTNTALIEFERTIAQLELDLKQVRSKLANARDYYHLFSLLGQDRISDVGYSPLTYYYARPETQPFFSAGDTSLYGAVRPIFRIKKENLSLRIFPKDQGFLSLQPVRSDHAACEQIPPHRYWRSVVEEESDGVMNPDKLSPVLARMEREGYRLQGDIFLYQIMNANRDHPNKVICIECEIAADDASCFGS